LKYEILNLASPMKNLYKDIKKSILGHFNFVPVGHEYHRLEVLIGMIYSTIVGMNCSLETQGNNLPEVGDYFREKESRLKQAKRWLMSKWVDYTAHYQPFILGFVEKVAKLKKELIFVIDGSETGNNCVTLMISLVWGKRSIPIIWVTRQGKKGHFPEQMHIDLLSSLSNILEGMGINERIVILGDGEFDGEQWVKFIESKKWEYVFRTSLDRKVNHNGDTFPISQLHVDVYLECGFALFGVNNSHAILWKGKHYKDPIPLITNMEIAKMACRYYKKRFAIETLFKDIKSNGFNIHKVKISAPDRIQNLLIVVALAFLFAFALGKAAKKAGQNLAQVYRIDRIKNLSDFKFGVKILNFCLNSNTCISCFFSKSFDFFIHIQT
jgi:hypothetical protein